MLARRRGRDKCFCLCHESAFARGFTGKYGPPCIVADIFRSVSQKALSREVVPSLITLCSAQSVVGFVEPWPREGELPKLITARSLLHDSGLLYFW